VSDFDDERLLPAVAAEAAVAASAVKVLTRREGRLVGRATLPAGVVVVVKASAKAGEFGAEAAAVRTLSAAGLPVSNVRVLSDGPPSVIALDWTPGRAVGADDVAQVRRQVVDLLRRVHTLPAHAPDERLAAELVKRIDGWCGYAMKWWSRQDRIGAESAGRAEAWYQRVRPLVAGRSGSLVLLDGVPDHFLVGPDEQVRLIDVAELGPGDPVMDLAVLHLHAPGLLAGVLDEYHQAEVQDRHLTELLPFYVFLRALAAAEWSGSVLHDFEQGAAWLHRAAAEFDSATGRSRSEHP
jgi:hypothetical protein